MSSFWPVPLIPDDKNNKDYEKQTLQEIVKKNNMAVYAVVLLSGDDIEGE